MLRPQILAAILMTLVFTVLCGLIYPLVVYGIGQAAFADKANGSFITQHGREVGSSLLGQSFTDADGNPDLRYFQPRPSAAGNGYDPLNSSATNLGPGADKLIGQCNPVPKTDDKGNPVLGPDGNQINQTNSDGSPVCDPSSVPQRVAAYRQTYGLGPHAHVPVDAVTASGSGLDPHISVANALFQARSVADHRKLPVEKVLELVLDHTEQRQFGFLGEKTVNVLQLNLALDAMPGR
jgi:K+-transporting ATPase ATPase C chain